METVKVTRAGGVVTVTMNRPERKNALTRGMTEELRSTFDAVAHNAEDRVLVLTGEGGDFCSGADLSDADAPAVGDPASSLEWVRALGDVVSSLHRLSKPTIAKVDGVAVGAGLGLAIACDLVVASTRARLSMIFTRRALSPDCATSWLLPRLVGSAKAKELAFFGEILDAGTAVRIGLVNRAVTADELDAQVASWAESLAEGPSLALSTTKALLDAAWSTSFAEAIEREAECQAANLAGADVTEAIAAFSEKRSPRFVGS
ncbi:MAG: enoyl-CoA hydratase-related protein [Actinomycetota bacterium]|nr:enoyl-CoA hydratase-related protein [Actinomycetota bacterium]